MVTLEVYQATDRRCYNGALSGDLTTELNHTAALTKRMKEANKYASCVYFPVENKYLVFAEMVILTHNFHFSKQKALIEAIEILEARNDRKES
jgi:hypothetical protein